MKIIQSFLTKNPCYTAGKKIMVKGLMLHLVGCAQPKASVFINNWNNASHSSSCVHGFIDGNDGTIYQTLPWNHRGWHGGGSSFPPVLQTFKTAKTVWEAADAVLLKFEKPANQSAAVQKNRASFGQDYYDKYAGGSSAALPYLVQITASVLNVRKGPGTGYAIATTVKQGGVYTIVEESNGWGKLKSGAGWISLAYTKKR